MMLPLPRFRGSKREEPLLWPVGISENTVKPSSTAPRNAQINPLLESCMLLKNYIQYLLNQLLCHGIAIFAKIFKTKLFL